MDLIAFTLTADHAGTVMIDRGDGPEEVPKFGGGLLFTPTGDFATRDALDAGDGAIVLHAEDGPLIELLDALPAFKRTTVPDGAQPISMYARQSVEALRAQITLRNSSLPAALRGHGIKPDGTSKAALIAALEADDAARRGEHDPADPSPPPAPDADASATAAGDGSPGAADDATAGADAPAKPAKRVKE